MTYTEPQKVVLKEYNDSYLIVKIRPDNSVHEYVVCRDWNGESWWHGHYFKTLDSALEYFNKDRIHIKYHILSIKDENGHFLGYLRYTRATKYEVQKAVNKYLERDYLNFEKMIETFPLEWECEYQEYKNEIEVDY